MITYEIIFLFCQIITEDETPKSYFSTVDSRYLEFDGTMEKFESTVVRLERSYENTGSVVCLTTKGRQLERNFEELKPASHVPILGTILNIFDVFVAVFFLSVKFFESCETTDNF